MTQEEMRRMLCEMEHIIENQKELMMPNMVSDTMIKKAFKCWDKLKNAYTAMEDVLEQMEIEQIGAGYEQVRMDE